MRVRHGLAASVVGIIAFGVALPLSASADGTGGTIATITLSQGTLDITVPSGPVALTGATNSDAGTTFGGALGTVTVTDTRGVVDGTWTTTASSTDFIPGSGASPDIPNTGVFYAPGTVSTPTGGTGVYTPTDYSAAPGISAAVPVVTATAITGNQTATWSPTITVTVPAAEGQATYTATITHSVS